MIGSWSSQQPKKRRPSTSPPTVSYTHLPRECFRLQGFEDEQIDKILAITSDAQAYKQAGNSVTVTVIEAIGRRIRAVDEELRGAAA